MEANARFGKVMFDARTEVEPFTIVKMVQDQPQIYSMGGASELKFRHELSSAHERLDFTRRLLDALSPETLQVA